MLDRSAAQAYVNAKSNGMLQKSFVGQRAEKLFSVQSLSDLWTLLFKSEVPAVPELLLAKEIEKKALEKFISDYKKLLAVYTKPDQVLLTLLQYYDFENLKKITAAIAIGSSQKVQILNINPYNIINYANISELSSVTKNTEFSWLSENPSLSELQSIDNKIDLQYMKKLWQSTESLPQDEKKSVQEIILNEIIFKNILWALRLKVYYNMNESEVLPRLVYENDLHHSNDLFAGPAISILKKDVTDFAVWTDWKFVDCLNPHEEGVNWAVDPCWVGQCFRKKLNAVVLSKMHQNPMTSMVMVCFFKAKQNEYETICAAVEALRLGVADSQAMELVGVSSESRRK